MPKASSQHPKQPSARKTAGSARTRGAQVQTVNARAAKDKNAKPEGIKAQAANAGIKGRMVKEAESKNARLKEPKAKEIEAKKTKLKAVAAERAKAKEATTAAAEKAKTKKARGAAAEHAKTKKTRVAAAEQAKTKKARAAAAEKAKAKELKAKDTRRLKAGSAKAAEAAISEAKSKAKRGKLKQQESKHTKARRSKGAAGSSAAEWSAATIPSVPHMEEEGIALLGEHLTGIRVFLEYGSGGSSVMVAQAGVKSIYSVDSDRQFLKSVRRRLLDEGIPRNRYVPIYADIGPTKEWGRPVDASHLQAWPNYCAAPWRKLLQNGESPDLVLIDGRFRVASFLITLLMAPPGCVILFDDYVNRPEYHVVERYLQPSLLAGRMAEFTIEPVTQHHEILIDLLQYSTDSR